MAHVNRTLKLFGPSLLVGLVAPFVFPALRRAMAPVAKGMIKGGVLFTESIKEAAKGAREHVSDAVAEVKADLDRDAQESRSASDDHR